MPFSPEYGGVQSQEAKSSCWKSLYLHNTGGQGGNEGGREGGWVGGWMVIKGG